MGGYGFGMPFFGGWGFGPTFIMPFPFFGGLLQIMFLLLIVNVVFGIVKVSEQGSRRRVDSNSGKHPAFGRRCRVYRGGGSAGAVQAGTWKVVASEKGALAGLWAQSAEQCWGDVELGCIGSGEATTA